MRKSTVEPGRPQMRLWRMRIACWVHKATNAHSECVILIVFPQQQLLHESAILLCYTYEGWNFNSGNYLFTTDTK